MTPFLLIYAAVGVVVAAVMFAAVADRDAPGHGLLDLLGSVFVGALWLPFMVAMAGSWFLDVVASLRR